MEKTCTTCQITKPIDQFSLARNGTKSTRPIRKSKCKQCQAAAARAWYQDNKERAAGNSRAWNLRKLYGLTTEQYDAMFRQQDGKCAVCRLPADQGNLVVDHDHGTKAVRGLLCHNCNRALGLFKDSTDVVRRALSYLEGG
jgi:hypothetical protein